MTVVAPREYRSLPPEDQGLAFLLSLRHNLFDVSSTNIHHSTIRNTQRLASFYPSPITHKELRFDIASALPQSLDRYLLHKHSHTHHERQRWLPQVPLQKLVDV